MFFFSLVTTSLSDVFSSSGFPSQSPGLILCLLCEFQNFPSGLTGFLFFWGGVLFITFFYTLFFFKFYFIFKLYSIVLVLPNIEMNPPQWFSHPVCFALSNLLVSMAITFLHQAIIVSPKSSLPWSQTVSFSLVLSPQIITENLI